MVESTRLDSLIALNVLLTFTGFHDPFALSVTTGEMRVLASPMVTDLFLDEESQALAMLSDFIERPISLHAENGYTQEQFDIVLM